MHQKEVLGAFCLDDGKCFKGLSLSLSLILGMNFQIQTCRRAVASAERL